MAEQFQKGGQEAWFHDPGYWGGFFHSYDRFQVGGALDKPRKVHVFLPRDYEISSHAYPVLYLNDGDTVFFPGGAYQKTWNLAAILTRLYLRNQMRRLIVVAVAPVDRNYEYTHAPVWGQEWGGLDDYATYLATSVKGFVDTHYRTLQTPDQTLIAGASHGGLAAFYTAARYPDQFGNVAALSPSFWVGVDSVVEQSLSNYSGPFFGEVKSSALVFMADRTLREQRLKIYLDWGLVREGGEHNSFCEERATARGREMRDLLIQDYGYQEFKNLWVVEDPMGEHHEASWSARMKSILEIFFGV